MRGVLTLFLSACLAAPALACINDSELRNHEREFRSQYQEVQYTPPEPAQVNSRGGLWLGGAGLVMGAVGFGLMLRLRLGQR